MLTTESTTPSMTTTAMFVRIKSAIRFICFFGYLLDSFSRGKKTIRNIFVFTQV